MKNSKIVKGLKACFRSLFKPKEEMVITPKQPKEDSPESHVDVLSVKNVVTKIGNVELLEQLEKAALRCLGDDTTTSGHSGDMIFITGQTKYTIRISKKQSILIGDDYLTPFGLLQWDEAIYYILSPLFAASCTRVFKAAKDSAGIVRVEAEARTADSGIVFVSICKEDVGVFVAEDVPRYSVELKEQFYTGKQHGMVFAQRLMHSLKRERVPVEDANRVVAVISFEKADADDHQVLITSSFWRGVFEIFPVGVHFDLAAASISPRAEKEKQKALLNWRH